MIRQQTFNRVLKQIIDTKQSSRKVNTKQTFRTIRSGLTEFWNRKQTFNKVQKTDSRHLTKLQNWKQGSDFQNTQEPLDRLLEQKADTEENSRTDMRYYKEFYVKKNNRQILGVRN